MTPTTTTRGPADVPCERRVGLRVVATLEDGDVTS